MRTNCHDELASALRPFTHPRANTFSPVTRTRFPFLVHALNSLTFQFLYCTYTHTRCVTTRYYAVIRRDTHGMGILEAVWYGGHDDSFAIGDHDGVALFGTLYLVSVQTHTRTHTHRVERVVSKPVCLIRSNAVVDLAPLGRPLGRSTLNRHFTAAHTQTRTHVCTL